MPTITSSATAILLLASAMCMPAAASPANTDTAADRAPSCPLKTQTTQCDLVALNEWLTAVNTYVDGKVGGTTSSGATSSNKKKNKPSVGKIHVGRSAYGGLGIMGGSPSPSSSQITAATTTIAKKEAVLRIPMALSVSMEGLLSSAGDAVAIDPTSVVKMMDDRMAMCDGSISGTSSNSSNGGDNDDNNNASTPDARNDNTMNNHHQKDGKEKEESDTHTPTSTTDRYHRFRRPYAPILSYARETSRMMVGSVLSLALMAEVFLTEAQTIISDDADDEGGWACWHSGNNITTTHLTPFAPYIDCLPQLADLPQLALWSAKLEAFADLRTSSTGGSNNKEAAGMKKAWSASILKTMARTAEPMSRDDDSDDKSNSNHDADHLDPSHYTRRLNGSPEFSNIPNHFEDTEREYKRLMNSMIKVVKVGNGDVSSSSSSSKATKGMRVSAALKESLLSYTMCMVIMMGRDGTTTTTSNNGSNLKQCLTTSLWHRGRNEVVIVPSSGILLGSATAAGASSPLPHLHARLTSLYDSIFIKDATQYIRAEALMSSRAWNIRGSQYLVPISDFYNYRPKQEEVPHLILFGDGVGRSGGAKPISTAVGNKALMTQSDFHVRSMAFLEHHLVKSLPSTSTTAAGDGGSDGSLMTDNGSTTGDVLAYLRLVEELETTTSTPSQQQQPKGRANNRPPPPPPSSQQYFEVLSDRELIVAGRQSSTAVDSTQEVATHQQHADNNELYESYGDSNNGIYFRYHGFSPNTNPYECVGLTSYNIRRVMMGSGGDDEGASSTPQAPLYHPSDNSIEATVATRFGDTILKGSKGHCVYNTTVYQYGLGTSSSASSGKGYGSDGITSNVGKQLVTNGELDPVLLSWSVGGAVYNGALSVKKAAAGAADNTNGSNATQLVLKLLNTRHTKTTSQSQSATPSLIDAFFTAMAVCTDKGPLKQMGGLRSFGRYLDWYKQWQEECLHNKYVGRDGGVVGEVVDEITRSLRGSADNGAHSATNTDPTPVVARYLALLFQRGQLVAYRSLLLANFKLSYSSSNVEVDEALLAARRALIAEVMGVLEGGNKTTNPREVSGSEPVVVVSSATRRNARAYEGTALAKGAQPTVAAAGGSSSKEEDSGAHDDANIDPALIERVNKAAPIPSSVFGTVSTTASSHHLPYQLLQLQTEASLLEFKIPKKAIYRSHLGLLRRKMRRVKRLLEKAAGDVLAATRASDVVGNDGEAMVLNKNAGTGKKSSVAANDEL